MRIAIANRVSAAVGGAEEYLARIIPRLHSGHDLAFFFECTAAGTPLALPRAPVWFVDKIGATAALRALADWKPDIVYCNGLDTVAVERALTDVAPSIYSAHAYFGTCISGHKMHAFPSPRVCERRFDTGCLACYMPRRCGGLNPLTMLKMYRTESSRLAAIRRYSVVVVHSRHMLREYERHGVAVVHIPLPVPTPTAVAAERPPLASGDERRLLFLGRLAKLKGSAILIDAAVEASRSLPAVSLIVAGQGVEQQALERHALATSHAAPNLRVTFVGQVDRGRRASLLARTHALVVPSVWPEPFGMVGLEAAAFGVPAAAFAVGGIPEWLRDGVSGSLATPPTAKALADAIVNCVKDGPTHALLGEGARAVHAEFAAHDAIALLEKLFDNLRARRRPNRVGKLRQ